MTRAGFRGGIPHNKPALGRAEERAVVRVLRSGWIASGREVLAFERAFAARLGLPGAVSVNSGSSALHLALLALAIGPGDAVLVPTYACSALLNAVRYTGARPCPCDIRAGDLTIDPVSALARAPRRTRAVIVTHTFGFPAPAAPFRRAGLAVIEDGAQSLGASLDGRPVGTMGDAAIFSFGATKPMTSGTGGMVVSGNSRILALARDLRDYDRRPRYRTRFNYAMNDIAAALARAQLARLSGFIASRRALAAAYRKTLTRLPGVSFQEPAPGAAPSCYRFVIRVPDPGRVIRGLARREITAIRPVEPRHLLHRFLGLSPRAFPNAEAAVASIVSLPVHPGVSRKDQGRILAALEDVLS